MMTRVDGLAGYFALPGPNTTEQTKRENEIVRLLVFGMAADLGHEELAHAYARLCTDRNNIDS